MPERNSESTPKKRVDNVMVKKQKTTTTLKNHGSEIDDIFAARKRKRPGNKTTKKTNEDPNKQSMKPKKKMEKRSVEDDLVDAPLKLRKRTGDGLAIYTEDELGINKSEAGTTAQCPFDCSCCF